MKFSRPSGVDDAQMTADPDAAEARELAIVGNGYFVVRNPQTGENYATQAAIVSLDAEGYLATGNGAHLQGRVNGTRAAVGDLRISASDISSNRPRKPSILSYLIDKWGMITVHLSDGTSFLRGQIMLQNFQEPQALIAEARDLFSNLPAAGPLPSLAAPGTNGLGAIQSHVQQLSSATY